MGINSKYIWIAAGLGTGLLLLLWGGKKAWDYWDVHTKLRLRTLDPDMQRKAQKLLDAALKRGIKLRITSAYRSCEEQNILYAKGRTAPGKIVTYARCGQSKHNHRRAFDVVEIKNGKALWKNPNWELIGSLGEAAGLSWGGRWRRPDRPHFEG